MSNNTQVPNSNYALSGSITGSAKDTIEVVCNEGFEGGGAWVCQPDGTWIGTSCTKIPE